MKIKVVVRRDENFLFFFCQWYNCVNRCGGIFVRLFFLLFVFVVINESMMMVSDCGLVAHRTCSATGLPMPCAPSDSRVNRFTSGECQAKVN